MQSSSRGSNSLVLCESTVQSTKISPNFLVWKFCGNAQFPHQDIRQDLGIFRSEDSLEAVVLRCSSK